MQQQSVFYDSTIEPIERTNALDSAFGFQATLSSQVPPQKDPKDLDKSVSKIKNQTVRIGSLDLTFGGDPKKIDSGSDRVQVFQLIDLSAPTAEIIPRFSCQMRGSLTSPSPQVVRMGSHPASMRPKMPQYLRLTLLALHGASLQRQRPRRHSRAAECCASNCSSIATCGSGSTIPSRLRKRRSPHNYNWPSPDLDSRTLR